MTAHFEDDEDLRRGADKKDVLRDQKMIRYQSRLCKTWCDKVAVDALFKTHLSHGPQDYLSRPENRHK